MWASCECSFFSVIPVTVEESAVEMAATGHTPFYRRPTIEKDIHMKDIKELKIRIARRRLIARSEKAFGQREEIMYKKPPGAKLLTQICTCPCHHKNQQGQEIDLESGVHTSVLTKKKPSVVYQPDPNISKLDAWDTRLGLETSQLEPEGWMCINTAGSPEVLLYIHGYNNSHIEVRF